MVFTRVASTAVVLLALASYPTAQPRFSDWSAPVNLGPIVNSAFNEQAPTVSKNGLSLYFHSNRPDGFGANDLYVSRRTGLHEDWGPPVNLGPVINSASSEARPNLSRDGHWLFFNSNRPGFGGMDIWASYRDHVHDDFAWQPPVNLGAGVNSSFQEISASYFENDDAGAPQIFFASNRPGGPGAFDVYVSERLSDGTWGAATLVPELSSPVPEPGISVRFDGLEAFLVKGGPPAFDLWASTRQSVFHPWSEPVNLGPLVNSASSDEAPHIASDRETLYFESTRGGGSGGRDLWFTTRTRARP